LDSLTGTVIELMNPILPMQGRGLGDATLVAVATGICGVGPSGYYD
jgi:hypothetical protein